MRRLASAFTLVELLVVIAIVSALAAILFPVFAQAKESAKRAVCISNLREISVATSSYVSDYDDRFMLINHQPTELPNSRNDRTWVQLVLPYSHSFSIFHCPSDNSQRVQTESSFDQDVVPGDTDARYYTASMHTDYGFNYQYLSPILKFNGKWYAQPKDMGSVENPSSTLMFLDSVWALTNGEPWGGGSWLVTPPCRYYDDRNQTDSFTGAQNHAIAVYFKSFGWGQTKRDATEYGNVWPWHTAGVNTASVDGHVSLKRVSDLTAGCDPKSNWQGTIHDSSSYLWDLR